MEPKFECKYTRTEKIMQEFFGYSLFLKTSSMIINILLALFFIWGIIQLIVSPLPFNEKITFIAAIVVSAFALLFKIFVCFHNAKKFIRRDMEVNNCVMKDIDLKVYDDQICQATQSSNVDLDFNKIKKVIQTKNLILLMTYTELCLVFEKNSFTIGTSDEFLEFIRSKGFKT